MSGLSLGRAGLRVLRALAAVGLVYAGLCAVFFFLQERLIYFPGPPPAATPADYGIAFEELRLLTEDGVYLSAWLCGEPGSSRVMLVCHGNAGSIEGRIELASEFAAMGFGTLLFDYRGYGASGGAPGEAGTYLDATAAFDALASRGVPPAGIVAYGESLGGAVAIELARRRPVRAVVVESGFTSLPDAGAEHYPWLPVRWLARHRYPSLERVSELRVPLCVLHSRGDEVVPFEHGQRLFREAAEPKRFIETAGLHNGGGFRAAPEARSALEEFLRGL